MNDQIRRNPIRLIDEQEQMVGVVDTGGAGPARNWDWIGRSRADADHRCVEFWITASSTNSPKRNSQQEELQDRRAQGIRLG